MNRVLLVDDDVELCQMLAEYLGNEGFVVATAQHSDQVAVKTCERDFDIVVLDVMLPTRNGFDLLRDLRGCSRVPVIMLTARGEDVDSIVGLELGADDYLAKPCNPRVLVARIRALLRRAEGTPLPFGEAQIVDAGALRLSHATREVTLDGISVDLTSTEFSVLEVLVREAGHVVAKSDLSERALDRKLGRYDRSLDMHISNLRKKLGTTADGGERIKTVRGVGYLYVA